MADRQGGGAPGGAADAGGAGQPGEAADYDDGPDDGPDDNDGGAADQ